MQLNNTRSYFAESVRPGSMRGSIVSLTAATVGAAMITLPYLMARTGLALGFAFILLGALLSFYAGHLIVSEQNHIVLKSDLNKI